MKRDLHLPTSQWTVRLSLSFLLTVAALAQDPREIFRRSVEKDQTNRGLRQQYTYLEKEVTKEFDKSGKVKSTVSTVRDVSILYGHQFSRLIEKDGKPLSAKDAQKEKERLEKFTAKWEHETPEDRQKRRALREKNRQKNDAFLKEITEAYDLRLLGDEKVAGQDTWVIQAEPHPGYRPKLDGAKYFAKVHGKVWIDKATYQCVKADAESIDTISFGLVLFRLGKGARLQFEETRVNDEIWMPKLQHITAGARVGIFYKASIDQVVTFENYRKFQSDSRVVSTEEKP
jgi:hypothetical protein